MHAGHGAVAVEIDETEAASLGTVDFEIPCAPEAAATFERGIALLHHMMYVEARSTFQQVVAADPACAFGHWGVAMTLFQPLWPTRPGAEQLQQGFAEAQKAKALAGTARERAWVAAVEGFFEQPESSDYWARIRKFEQAMESVYRADPQDREAAAFYALALLATAPDASDRLAQHAEAAAILVGIYERETTHPGAIHYTIHANDITGREHQRLDIVRSYDDIAPSVPHALHMPTHIFVRLGAWKDVIHWNIKSAEAALDFPAGDAISHHYPHALDYLIYAHLQRGDDASAREILEGLGSAGDYQKSFISAYHLSAMPARYAVERRQWAEAAAVPAPRGDFPWQKFPWPQANTELARGLGAAYTGDAAAAETAVARLEELRASAEAAGEGYFAQQVEVSRKIVAGALARARGRQQEAVETLRAAAELEASMEKHPVTPGSVQPAGEIYGDVLLEMGRAGEALEAYETSLATWPRRFNSLLGAARAATAEGDRGQATDYYRQLVELAGETGAERPGVEEARRFIGSTGARSGDTP